MSAFAMSLGVATALGFARFSYGLILPAMKSNLHWTYLEAGSLNILNAVGYGFGAIISAPVAKRYGAKKSFRFAMAAITILTFAPAINSSLGYLFIVRAASGVFGAMLLVVGGAIVAHSNIRSTHRVATGSLGIFFGGAGLGTAISGIGIPPLLHLVGNSKWQAAWILLGVLCFISLIITNVELTKLTNPTPPKDISEKARLRSYMPSFLGYGIFGAGYISFMTFIVAFLKQNGSSSTFVSVFYIVLGVVSVFSGFFWDRPLGALRAGWGLGATLTVISIGTILPLVSKDQGVVLLSAALIGLGLMAATTAITRLAQRNSAPSQVAKILGTATLAMAIGQSTGPLVTGYFSDTSSGLRIGMIISSAFCLIAILITIVQKDFALEKLTRKIRCQCDTSKEPTTFF